MLRYDSCAEPGHQLTADLLAPDKVPEPSSVSCLAKSQAQAGDKKLMVAKNGLFRVAYGKRFAACGLSLLHSSCASTSFWFLPAQWRIQRPAPRDWVLGFQVWPGGKAGSVQVYGPKRLRIALATRKHKPSGCLLVSRTLSIRKARPLAPESCPEKIACMI